MVLDMAALVKRARAQGWRVERTASGHVRWYRPDALGGGWVMTGGLHATSWRGMKKATARLRRNGLRVGQGES